MAEYHPDKYALERYVRGEAGAAAERWIEDHLRSGCAICQRSVDELLPGLEPGDEHCAPLPRLRHERRSGLHDPLVGSAAHRPGRSGGFPCSEAVTAAPARAARGSAWGGDGRRERPGLGDGRDGGSPASADKGENAAWDRIFAKLEQRIAMIATEREAAPRLLRELLQRPAAERRALASAGRRFHTLTLCDLLIDSSLDAGSRDSAEAIALAELGILIADHLDTRYYGLAVVHDLRARAWAYLGNARRLAADFAGAEQAMAFAESLSEEGSADPLEEARLLDLKASLLSDQGRFEEAAELLDAVIDLCEDVKDLHRKGRALISKGAYLGCAGWPQLAVELISQGLTLLDEKLEPRLALAARHDLAWFLNDCGRCDRAQTELDSFRLDLGAGGDPRMELRLEWLETRIAHRAGRWQEAEQRLGRLLQRSVERGLGYEAALVMLDLATVYLEQGKEDDVRRLADAMLPIFLALDIHRQAVAALVTFQQAAAAGRLTHALLRDLAAYLQRARKNPRLGFKRAA